MALVIVAGASGQHAAVVYEAAMLSEVCVAGFAIIGDETPAPLLDCQWLGMIKDIGFAEISRGSTFIVACGSNALRHQESEALRAQGASFQSVYHPAAIVSPSADIGLRIPRSSRSAFRDNRDQRSEMMAISIPTSSRSVFRHDGDQMRDVLVV